jgi:hypothetical protein
MSSGKELRAFRRVVEALRDPAPAVIHLLAAPRDKTLLSQELPLPDRPPFAALSSLREAGASGGEPALVSAATTYVTELRAAKAAPAYSAEVRATEAAQPTTGAGRVPLFSPPATNGPAAAVYPLRTGAKRSALSAPLTATEAAGPGETAEVLPFPQRDNPRDMTLAGSAANQARTPAEYETVGTAPPGTSPPPSGSRDGYAEASLNRAFEEAGRMASALLARESPAQSVVDPPAESRYDVAPGHSLTGSPGVSGAGIGARRGQPSAPLERGTLEWNRVGGAGVAVADPASQTASASPVAAPALAASTPPYPAAFQRPIAAFASPGRNPQTVAPGEFETAAGTHPDAEYLAELIGEILAEQARRHGVDLS